MSSSSSTTSAAFRYREAEANGIKMSDNDYPMNPFDGYPESASDDEILDDFREQNQISNDLWQSTHFRDNHCGEWIGIDFHLHDFYNG